MTPSGWPLGLLAAMAGVAQLTSAGCSRPLPDAGGPAARTYVTQCGVCHEAYSPSLLTAAMWEVQVTRMDQYRSRRGLPPLTEAERATILEYLRAHAG